LGGAVATARGGGCGTTRAKPSGRDPSAKRRCPATALQDRRGCPDAVDWGGCGLTGACIATSTNPSLSRRCEAQNVPALQPRTRTATPSPMTNITFPIHHAVQAGPPVFQAAANGHGTAMPASGQKPPAAPARGQPSPGSTDNTSPNTLPSPKPPRHSWLRHLNGHQTPCLTRRAFPSRQSASGFRVDHLPPHPRIVQPM